MEQGGRRQLEAVAFQLVHRRLWEVAEVEIAERREHPGHASPLIALVLEVEEGLVGLLKRSVPVLMPLARHVLAWI